MHAITLLENDHHAVERRLERILERSTRRGD
ncbi:MAG: hypothetical protein JWO77_2585 [Ilumatobacteraceae bacterium]|nr:hypothetical protein [Ilumatobacteraceae bacterium]